MSSRTLKLPSAVIAARDSSNAAIAEAIKAATPAPSEPPADPPPAATIDPPPATPPAEPAAAAPADDAAQLRAEVSRLTAELSAAKDAQTKADQRYAVLEGKYRTETADLRNRLSEVEADLVEITNRREPPKTKTSEEDKASILGPEALQVLREEIEAHVETGTRRMVEPVASAVAKAEFERFKVAVSEKVADWQQIEDREDFQVYMNEPHPETGLPRGKHLNDAVQKRDVQRTALFYDGFKRKAGLLTDGAPPPASPVKPLADRVAPTGASTASTPATTQGRVYSNAEVAKFYTDYAQIKPRLSPKERAEWEAKERDITLASQQGRIRR